MTTMKRMEAVTLRNGPKGGTYRVSDGWDIRRDDSWVTLQRGSVAFEVPREKVEWADLSEPRPCKRCNGTGAVVNGSGLTFRCGCGAEYDPKAARAAWEKKKGKVTVRKMTEGEQRELAAAGRELHRLGMDDDVSSGEASLEDAARAQKKKAPQKRKRRKGKGAKPAE